MIDNKFTLDVLCKLIAVGIIAFRLQLFIVGIVIFYTKARIQEEFEINYSSRVRIHTAYLVLSYLLYNAIPWFWK